MSVPTAAGDVLESVAGAQQRLLASLSPLGPESVALGDALGRVLAETLHAGRDLPGFDNSAMDGYAVRAVDIAAASAALPVALPVVGESRAGGQAPELTPGRAIRIMTGRRSRPGPIPWSARRTQGVRTATCSSRSPPPPGTTFAAAGRTWSPARPSSRPAAP